MSVLRFAPLLICIIFVAAYFAGGKEITVESLMSYAPSTPFLAALFLVLLYALKSLSVFFPIIILNVLGGFLFAPVQAIVVNTIGVFVELTIPYWIGRYSGTGRAEKLMNKYPKLGEIIGEDSGNDFIISYFLRAVSFLPGDAVSMCLGAIKIPYRSYLVGSLLGTLPGTIAATLIGMNITDPASLMFWVSIGLTVGISVVSFVSYFIWRKMKKKNFRCGKE